MKTKFHVIYILLLSHISYAQPDSTKQSDLVPSKYLSFVEKKIDVYSGRITGKTVKTLTKLSRWEKRIQLILERVSPEAAGSLFAPGSLTFTSALEKFKQGQQSLSGYRAKYNEYRDKLNTSLRYLQEQQQRAGQVKDQVSTTIKKMQELEDDVEDSEALIQFIRERKQQLIAAATKHLGRNRYMDKISREAYYYAETIRNYQELFSEPGRFENTAKELLKKIPGFRDFMEENSGISALLASNPVAATNSGNVNGRYAALGYQSNAAIVQSLQQRNYSGPGIEQLLETNAAALNDPIQQLKNSIPGSGNTGDMPAFKPNDMRSKTLMQRLELGTNLQFGRSNRYLPGTADIGMQLAYKLNTRSSAGIGAGCKVGLGNGIQDIKFSFGGINVRSFLDWKLKGNFYMNGGFEYNYNYLFRSYSHSSPGVITNDPWKPAALVGINKKYKLGKVNGNMMLLYDLLAKRQMPETQRLVFRFGYSF
jgi:hypothetical protein